MWELSKLTSSELTAKIEAVQVLLEDEPDILSPTLRAWVAALGASLDNELHSRERLRDRNTAVPCARSPHDEA